VRLLPNSIQEDIVVWTVRRCVRHAVRTISFSGEPASGKRPCDKEQVVRKLRLLLGEKLSASWDFPGVSPSAPGKFHRTVVVDPVLCCPLCSPRCASRWYEDQVAQGLCDTVVLRR